MASIFLGLNVLTQKWQPISHPRANYGVVIVGTFWKNNRETPLTHWTRNTVTVTSLSPLKTWLVVSLTSSTPYPTMIRLPLWQCFYYIINCSANNKSESSWCQLCRHRWYRRLSRQTLVPLATTHLASWQLSVFREVWRHGLWSHGLNQAGE